MGKILLTGFEPFGGEPLNPSLEAIKLLNGETIDGSEIVSKGLPVVFGEARPVLEEYIKEINPELVISVGQAGGRSAISVERVAINVSDGRIPDNKGYQPIDEPINEKGPVAYWSMLPIKAIVKSIREAGIPAEVSQTAGTYVCNYIFYALMDILTEYKGIRGGFIHIPFIPEQAVRNPGQPSLSLEDIVKAIRIAIQTTLSHETDIVEAGGQIS
ncbi:pyroglutamyl-peptidase I [Pullulanibacillus sp. KACC 23026]|uniref:pyroglutamyl-peptidase I n=1 Tax=Pullulanibacillus sp. KACC 23026 TaxID=3028315 RepID=UPI0023B03BC4|nr:pyroglutamyl-peptidase I [Pullulanibacillus sp. KACC 23026]WEG14465.1 pyroglutamyl-peptidase I [Pullulanibacillus sp. KACC 23026]